MPTRFFEHALTHFASSVGMFMPCIAIPGNPTCIPAYCCYGNLAAWTGVRTDVNISYTETTCKNGIPTVVTKKKSCGTLCSDKHCSMYSFFVQFNLIIRVIFLLHCNQPKIRLCLLKIMSTQNMRPIWCRLYSFTCSHLQSYAKQSNAT